jgi:hypothetical protein
VATPEPARTADAGNQPKAPGTEGFRLPPGIGQELARGTEGSKGQKSPTGSSIASSLQNLESRLQSTDTLGVPSGTGQWIRGLQYDPMGADFTEWINHFKNEFYRNAVWPPSAGLLAARYTEIQLVVERDGSLSLNQLLTSCGNSALDKASRNAFSSSRLMALPADYGPKTFPIRVRVVFSEEAPSGS